MKKSVLFIVALMLFAGCTVIRPGHVGIKVNNFGSDRGVQNYAISTGMVFYMPGASTVFDYPTSMQTAIWTASPHEGHPLNEEITFNTKEGTAVSGDVSLSYYLIADSVPRFYIKFRSDNLDMFTHGFLRNIARDAFNEIGSRYTLEEVYGLKKEEFLKCVKERVNDQVIKFGVVLSQFGFTGALRMDPGIMSSLNKKLQAIQDAITSQNQLQQSIAGR